MKKCFVALLLFIPLCLSLNASSLKEEQTKGLELQGGYYEFFSITVSPLDAASQKFTAGMPFDIERDDIDPTKSEGNGVKIATWKILSSEHDFIVTVTPKPLMYRDSLPAGVVDPGEIGYELKFRYALRYYQNNQSHKMDNTEFTVKSDGTMIGVTNPLLSGSIAIDPGSYVGFENGEIYFKLTKEGADKVHTRSGLPEIPEGYYGCQVIVKLEIIK